VLYNSIELPTQAAAAAEVDATMTGTYTANEQKVRSLSLLRAEGSQVLIKSN